MANEPIITVVGNLTADPELRFTPSGAAVANWTMACTPRVKNGDQWEDGETLWLRCSIWREQAENVTESLTRGMEVIAQGRLKARSYETREGEKRTAMELEVDHVGPTLRWQTARVQRTGNRGGGQPRTERQRPQGGQPANDPWSTPAQQQGDPWAAPAANDEPPF